MRKILNILLLLVVCLGARAQREFPYPQIPEEMTENSERLGWMLTHFWESYDFGDCGEENRALGEQGFVDFASLMGHADSTQMAEAARVFVDKAWRSENREAFADLMTRYMGDPQSPVHDDRIYAVLLEAVSNEDGISKPERDKARELKELVSMNMPGTYAADFEYIDRQGKKNTLYGTKGRYTLLYFSDPECDHCREMLDKVKSSKIANTEGVTVLRIYPEENVAAWQAEDALIPATWIDARVSGGSLVQRGLYWFAQMPSLYLLDEEKRVIAKELNIEHCRCALTCAD